MIDDRQRTWQVITHPCIRPISYPHHSSLWWSTKACHDLHLYMWCIVPPHTKMETYTVVHRSYLPVSDLQQSKTLILALLLWTDSLLNTLHTFRTTLVELFCSKYTVTSQKQVLSVGSQSGAHFAILCYALAEIIKGTGFYLTMFVFPVFFIRVCGNFMVLCCMTDVDCS